MSKSDIYMTKQPVFVLKADNVNEIAKTFYRPLTDAEFKAVAYRVANMMSLEAVDIVKKAIEASIQ